MRRFSSEGNLLDLDVLPRRRLRPKNTDNDRESGTYTPLLVEEALDGKPAEPPFVQEPIPSEAGKKGLTKELSISVKNLTELKKSHLTACCISEGCRAYSDSQLAPAAHGSAENIGKDDLPPPSSSSTSNPLFKAQHHHRHRHKLSAAKLHLRSLFGQVGCSVQCIVQKSSHFTITMFRFNIS